MHNHSKDYALKLAVSILLLKDITPINPEDTSLD
jgi:hypothetical protein